MKATIILTLLGLLSQNVGALAVRALPNNRAAAGDISDSDVDNELLKSRFTKIGPFGTVDGDGIHDPFSVLPFGITPSTVLCRGGSRLNYVEIDYVFQNALTAAPIPVNFGDPRAGVLQGPVHPRTEVAEEITALIPYVCTDGWFKGAICGLRFKFRLRADLLCGLDDLHGFAEVPESLRKTKGYHFEKGGKLFSFFADTIDKGRVITKLGWYVG